MDITRKKSLIAPLTYLKATIDLGSYTKAAEYLGTTESRLSKEIKAFEKTMKTKLLSRCSRGMTPRTKGWKFTNRRNVWIPCFMSWRIILWQSTAFPAI